jgi:hypothetical protein
MTTETAIEILRVESGGNTANPLNGLGYIARAAKFNTHPDRNNGDRSRYDAVDQAVQVLKRAGRL